jgi:hypothetical protein
MDPPMRWSNDIQCGDQWNKLKSENPNLAKEVECVLKNSKKKWKS